MNWKKSITTLSGVILTLTLAVRAQEPARDPRALDILKASDAAARAVTSASYRYEFLGVGASGGRFVGRARMQQVTDRTDSNYWTEAEMVVPPPGLGDAPRKFQIAKSAERYFLLDEDRRIFRTATVDRGASHIDRTLVYLILYHFVDAQPFRFELEYNAGVEWLGTDTVDGVECDIVRVVRPPQMGTSEVHWYIGKQDRLPRRQVVHGFINGRLNSFTFTMYDLRIGETFSAADFTLESPRDYATVDSDERPVSVGSISPDWSLQTPAGETVRLSDHRGEIVVLDFWVTWCPFCQRLMPGVQKMHEEFADAPVTIYGVNLWESGDPIAHMKEHGFTYDILLRGEPLADLYKIAWQPAMVVIGPEGRILFWHNGFDRKRNDDARATILSALERRKTAKPAD